MFACLSLFSPQKIGKFSCGFCVVGQRDCEAHRYSSLASPKHLLSKSQFWQCGWWALYWNGDINWSPGGCSGLQMSLLIARVEHFLSPISVISDLWKAWKDCSLNFCPLCVRKVQTWKATQQGKLHYYFSVIRVGKRRNEMWGKVHHLCLLQVAWDLDENNLCKDRDVWWDLEWNFLVKTNASLTYHLLKCNQLYLLLVVLKIVQTHRKSTTSAIKSFDASRNKSKIHRWVERSVQSWGFSHWQLWGAEQHL